MNKFARTFKNTVFTKPEILEIRAVDVFRSKAVTEMITEKASAIANQRLQQKTKDEIQLSDVNSGINDMLSSFRLAVGEDNRKKISKGAGKKIEDDLDAIVDEVV